MEYVIWDLIERERVFDFINELGFNLSDPGETSQMSLDEIKHLKIYSQIIDILSKKYEIDKDFIGYEIHNVNGKFENLILVEKDYLTNNKRLGLIDRITLK